MSFDIISVANAKGGAGKSTLTKILLSATLAAGKNVVAFDTDPNGTLIQWQQRAVEAGNWPSSSLAAHVDTFEKIERGVSNLKDIGFEGNVFIDTAGRGSTTHLKIAVNSDFVIVPMQLTVDSMNVSLATIESLQATIDATEGCTTQVYGLRNMVGPKSKRSALTQKAYDEIGKHKWCMESCLGEYDLISHWDVEGPLVTKLARESKGGEQQNYLKARLTERVLQEGLNIINELRRGAPTQ